MTRPQKVATVEEIRSKLESARAAVLTEYRGLKVAELAELRAALRSADAEYKIFKNTLARRAAVEAGLNDLASLLDGPTAITFVRGDAVTVAKALRDYARTNPALVLKGGILGTRIIRSDEVVALADIEPREVLLAKIAGGMQAPLTKAAGLFQAFTRKMAYGLKALIDQRVAAGESLPPPSAVEVTEEPATADAAAPTAEATEEPAPTAEATEEPAPTEAAAPTAETTPSVEDATPAAETPPAVDEAPPAPAAEEPAGEESPSPEPSAADVIEEAPTAAAVDGPPPVEVPEEASPAAAEAAEDAPEPQDPPAPE